MTTKQDSMNFGAKSLFFGLLALAAYGCSSGSKDEPRSAAPVATATPVPTILPPSTANGCPKPGNVVPGVTLADPSVSWQNGMSQFFTNNCGTCHNGQTQRTDYRQYATVVSNLAVIRSKLTAGEMPPKRGLTALELDAFNGWANAGAPQVAGAITSPTPYPPQGIPTPTSYPPGGPTPLPPTGPTANPDCYPTTTYPYYPNAPTTTLYNPNATPTPFPGTSTLKPTYALGVQPILAKYCLSCHSTATLRSPALVDINSAKLNYTQIMSSIAAGRMPKNGQRLTAEEMQILQMWGSPPNAPYGQFAP